MSSNYGDSEAPASTDGIPLAQPDDICLPAIIMHTTELQQLLPTYIDQT